MYSLHVSLSAFNSFTPISLTAEYFLILQRCCRRRFQLWRMSVWVGSRVAGRRISFQTSHDWACPQLPLFPTPVSQTRYTQRPRGRNSLHSCFSWILFDAQNEDGLFSELIKFHKTGWNADWDFWKKKKKNKYKCVSYPHSVQKETVERSDYTEKCIIATVSNTDFSLIVLWWMKYNWMKCQNKWTTSPDKMQ